MKKKILSLLLVFTLCFALVACDKEGDETPEGMKSACEGNSLGFTMYVPEGWVTSSYGTIASAYVSNLDTSSVSLVRVDLGAVAFEDYVKTSLEKSQNAPTYLEEGKAVNLGNAKRALSYVYTYNYGEYAFQFMQVLAEAQDGGVYLFTYGASNSEKYEGETYYQSHLTEVTSIMGAIVFGTKTDVALEEVVYGTDDDGYKLVSDEKTAGFSLYIPETFRATLSLGIVLAEAQDGANVTVAEATATGVAVREYYENRLAEVEVLFDEVREITELTECQLGNSVQACYAEYSYKDGENVYRVYQVIAVSGGSMFSQKGYVFTYTAPEGVYGAHMDEVQKMMEKIRF